MRAGKMRSLLHLQSQDVTRDAGGGYIEAWQDVATNAVLWAEILPLRSVLQNIHAQRMTEISHKIRTRYRADIRPGHRLKEPESGRCFYIERVVDPDERQTEIEIYATERVAD